jgi:uncharacterized RDD family membrane protein YckC
VSDGWGRPTWAPGPALPAGPSGPVLPVGLGIAGVGARIAAFVLDLLCIGLLSLIPATIAVIVGAVAVSPEALDQMNANPNVYPNVPLLVVNLGPLIACAALWVAMAIAYGAVCWPLFRGTPGQRFLSLQVAEHATGKNLSIVRAAVRSIILFGVPGAAAAVVAVATCHMLTIVVPGDLGRFQPQSRIFDGYGFSGAFLAGLSASTMLTWAWPVGLLLSTLSRNHRGLHDRIAGSVVVGRAHVAAGWGPHAPTASTWAANHPAPPVSSAPQAPAAGGWAGSATPDQGESPGSGSPEAPAPNVWPGVLPPDQAAPWASPPPPTVEPGGWISPTGEPAGLGRQGALGSKLPEGIRIARFSRRMGAYGIDCAILLVTYLVIAAVVAGPNANGEPLTDRQWMISGLSSGVLQLLYFVLSWRLFGGSIGQKLGGLRVLDEGHGRLGTADALARWAVLQGPFALYSAAPKALAEVVVFGALAWAVFGLYKTRDDPDGQGYHDRIAHTVVVEEA